LQEYICGMIQVYSKSFQDWPLIDVRSPSEFAQGHIIGAVNIPLFSNDERAIVGTAYKQQGKDDAVLLGLEFVGPKMASIVRECLALSAKKQIRVHCWRGGMRSQSVAWLLKQAGFNVEVLPGGYKGYKQEVRDFFEQEFKLLVLGGPTGSGKTKILHQLKALGQQVIDLEGLANHKGSSFGSLGQEKQPSTEHYENLLAYELQLLDRNQVIWVEDESRKIGTVVINIAFWTQIHHGDRVLVKIPMFERIERLVEEYGVFPKEDLAAAVTRIGKKIGPQHLKAALEQLEAGNLAEVAKASLEYYDKAYEHSATKRLGKIIMTLESDTSEPSVIAKNLLLADQIK
jgi:tRNA 2-selenouridine synthase